MNTIKDFENAPIGATATHKATGNRVMKMPRTQLRWILPNGLYVDDESVVKRGYTLDPSAPTTAREALDLAWELAHPVKEGQVIPKGTQLLELYGNQLNEYTAVIDHTVSPNLASTTRALDPLPDPEPDWIDAPAVLARLDEWDRDEREVFTPAHEEEGSWVAMFSAPTHHWSKLRDVTPLYPKEGQDA